MREEEHQRKHGKERNQQARSAVAEGDPECAGEQGQAQTEQIVQESPQEDTVIEKEEGQERPGRPPVMKGPMQGHGTCCQEGQNETEEQFPGCFD